VHHTTFTRTGATQWVTVIALVVALVMAAAVTNKHKTTSATTALSSTTHTLRLNVTTTRVRLPVALPTALLARRRHSTHSPGTRTGLALPSEVPPVDRATGLSRPSPLMRLGQEHQMALRQMARKVRTRGREDSRDRVGDLAMMDAEEARAQYVAVDGDTVPSRPTIAPFSVKWPDRVKPHRSNSRA
jgi:hypothetical protein